MLKSLLICSLAFALAGCFQPMRPSEGHLHVATPAPAPTANIPSPVQALPILPPPKPVAAPETYSVVVNNVRVQDLLFALARDAKLNVDINPGLTGNVTLNAIDQTLPQLLSRIAKQIDMRYEFDGPNLTVMPDTPVLRMYKVDYVNMSRKAEGTVSASGQINSTSSSGQAANNSSSANSSTVTVTNSSTNDFWDTLIKNVTRILQDTDKIFPAAQAVNVPATSLAPDSTAGQSGQAAAPAPVPTVTYREAASIIANPEAGILSIRATARQHEKIQEFLDQVLTSAKRQVIIEATIVEVQLSNDYQQGIDWAVLSGSAGLQFLQGGLYRNTDPSAGPVLAQLPIPAVGALTATPDANLLAAQYNSKDFKATIQLLESFGNVRVLSSPRISVINNQTAVLKVVDNLVYFNVSSQTSQAANVNSVTNFTTTPQTVSVGFIMNVTPQISADGSVLLNVKPTIRRLIGRVDDPNPNLGAIKNSVPQIREREMESVLKLQSGQIGVMGGLIEDQLQDNADTLPGINQIPFLGDLFSNKNIQNTKSELVIFIRPIVIKDPSVQGDYHDYSSYLPGPGFMSQRHPSKPAAMDGGSYR